MSSLSADADWLELAAAVLLDPLLAGLELPLEAWATARTVQQRTAAQVIAIRSSLREFKESSSNRKHCIRRAGYGLRSIVITAAELLRSREVDFDGDFPFHELTVEFVRFVTPAFDGVDGGLHQVLISADLPNSIYRATRSDDGENFDFAFDVINLSGLWIDGRHALQQGSACEGGRPGSHQLGGGSG